jgi:hypothetical protein
MQVKKSNQSFYKRRINKEISGENPVKMIKIAFENNFMLIYLAGGRILSVPLKSFPLIKKLNRTQRQNYHIAGGISLDFDDSDEVYHINELLGLK